MGSFLLSSSKFTTSGITAVNSQHFPDSKSNMVWPSTLGVSGFML